MPTVDYGELLWERNRITTFPDVKSLGRTSIYFYLISKLSGFEECFEPWDGPWSVHNQSQAGISLQGYKCTDCSIRVVKKDVTLNTLWDRSQQNLTGTLPLIWHLWFTSLLHTLLTAMHRPGFVM